MAQDSKVHVAWLSGSYHRRSAMMTRIKDRFPDSEYVVIDSDKEFEFLMSKLRSGGCFDSSRLIAVTAIPKTKNANEKKKYIERMKKIISGPMTDCFLVFNGIEPTKEKAVFNAVKDYAKIYEFESIIPNREIAPYVAKRLKAFNLRASQEVSHMIGDYCAKQPSQKGYSADMIEMALSSLSSALPDGSEITSDHVETITFQHDSFVIWDMMNALDSKDCDKVIALLSKLQLTGNNLTQSITEMVTALIWRYRLILMIREGYSSKDSRDKILQDVLAMRKMTKTGVGLSATYEPDIVKSGPNEGKPASFWSHQVATIAMDGLYGSTPAADQWTRRDIYAFFDALTSGLLCLRGATENEALLIADTILMLGCKLLPRKDAKAILESLRRQKEIYA
jgi:DNA polymerase III delta subunit